MSDSPLPNPPFSLDPSLLDPSITISASASTPLAQDAHEAIAHISQLTDMELSLDETAVAVAGTKGEGAIDSELVGTGTSSGAVEADAERSDGTTRVEQTQETNEYEDDEGGYSPSQPQGLSMDLEEEDASDPYAAAAVDDPTTNENPDDSNSTAGYSPSAPQSHNTPLPFLAVPSSTGTNPTSAYESDPHAQSDADAEGEIDMDLAGDGDGEDDVELDGGGGDEDGDKEGRLGSGMVVDPALLGLSGFGGTGSSETQTRTQTQTQPAQQEQHDSGSSDDTTNPHAQTAKPESDQHEDHPQAQIQTQTQTQTRDENENQAFRRPPNARRRSPSYTMPDSTGPAPSSVPVPVSGMAMVMGMGMGSSFQPPPIGAGIPARPGSHPSGPAGGGGGGGRGRSSISSPIKPFASASATAFASNTGSGSGSGSGARQDYQQKFDFEGWTFPDGLDDKCGPARRHPVLVDGWGKAKAKKSPALISQALHALFEAARADGDVEEARAWFAEFEGSNPTATGPLLKLIDLELEHGNFPQVVVLYEKALRGLGGSVGAVPGVGIWTSYLHYIRRQNPIPPPTPTNAAAAEVVRQTVKSAYELALKECGNDISAGGIWQEYIGFLGEKEYTNAWEIQQQVDAIRKVYQRAVVIPMYEVEAIWREYDAFENKQNKMTAKKFLAERSPLYMTARTALRDLRGHLENLVPLDVPPRPTWTQSDRDLVIAWRKYLKWEETNPLDIDDPAALQSRVLYAMKKCLTQMRFFPELWYHTSTYALAQSKPEDAAAYLKNGLEANPTSFLLTFAHAEHEEGQKNFAVVKTTFESLIKHHGEQIDKLKASIAEEAEAAKGPELEGDKDVKVNQEDIDMDGVEPTLARKRYLEREARGTAVTERRAKELEEMMSAAGVVWIMYMRFARRAEGLKLARSVFTQARKSSYVSWQVFEASAYMEYHCNKDASVATKIFELGLKAFPDEVAFAVKFLQFLLQINDDSNARALFERLALKFSPEKARPIWDTWARYEYLYSDLSACQKLEARFAEAYPADAPLKRFAARYNYLGLDEIAIRDLGFGLRTQAPAPLPANKRSLPEESPGRSPRPEPRFRDDRGPPMRNEPPAKRARPVSRDREPPRRAMPPNDNGYHGGGRRDASPPRRIPERIPPVTIPPSEPLDRSGLPISIVRFLGNLPSARSFDGPIFRADDIMNVLRDARLPGAMSRPGDYRGPPPVGRTRF